VWRGAGRHVNGAEGIAACAGAGLPDALIFRKVMSLPSR